jgi:hypothetical protein
MKLGSNSVEDHPQLSHNGHPVDDGALVGAGSLWPELSTSAFGASFCARSPYDDEPYRNRNAQFSSLKTKNSSSFELFWGETNLPFFFGVCDT